jgi:hypothetical protein
MIVAILFTHPYPLMPKMNPSARSIGKGSGALFFTPAIPHVVEKT